MSSVGVLIEKESKCFCEREEKKSKCPKKNFQSVERGVKEEKKCKCEISGVRKEKWKENFRGKKNQSVSWENWKFEVKLLFEVK